MQNDHVLSCKLEYDHLNGTLIDVTSLCSDWSIRGLLGSVVSPFHYVTALVHHFGPSAWHVRLLKADIRFLLTIVFFFSSKTFWQSMEEHTEGRD